MSLNYLIRPFLMVLLCVAALPINAQESPAELGVAAIGLVVSDLAESEYFYTQVLGMKKTGEFSLDSEWSKEAGVANEKPFSVKVFKLVDGPSATTLKLVQFGETKRAPLEGSIDEVSGVKYITLNYLNLEDVISRIRSEGIEIVGHVQRDNYQLLFVRDPDGVFIELIGPPDADDSDGGDRESA